MKVANLSILGRPPRGGLFFIKRTRFFKRLAVNSRFCESIRERRTSGNYPPNVLDPLSWLDVDEASGNLLELSIRMVAGFAEIAEKDFLVAGVDLNHRPLGYEATINGI